MNRRCRQRLLGRRGECTQRGVNATGMGDSDVLGTLTSDGQGTLQRFLAWRPRWDTRGVSDISRARLADLQLADDDLEQLRHAHFLKDLMNIDFADKTPVGVVSTWVLNLRQLISATEVHTRALRAMADSAEPTTTHDRHYLVGEGVGYLIDIADAAESGLGMVNELLGLDLASLQDLVASKAVRGSTACRLRVQQLLGQAKSLLRSLGEPDLLLSAMADLAEDMAADTSVRKAVMEELIDIMGTNPRVGGREGDALFKMIAGRRSLRARLGQVYDLQKLARFEDYEASGLDGRGRVLVYSHPSHKHRLSVGHNLPGRGFRISSEGRERVDFDADGQLCRATRNSLPVNIRPAADVVALSRRMAGFLRGARLP